MIGEAIENELSDRGIETTLYKITPELEVDFFEYNLIFMGAPVYANLPPKPVMRFLENRRRAGDFLKAAAPERPGCFAVMYCTYGGGHTGDHEAIPCLKFMGQTFEHMGIRVVNEWGVVGIFRQVKDPDYNVNGRLGDITSRPDERDVRNIRGRVAGLLHQLKNKLPPENG
jgi:hypothetical protein